MNKFVFEAKHFLLKALRLFFYSVRGGNTCLICGLHTSLFPVCRQCKLKYFKLPDRWEEERCSVCGKELISSRDKCMKCRQDRVLVHVDRLYPLYSYRLWNKSLMFKWKISGERCLSEFFAQLAADFLKKIKVSEIIPIPPRKGKIRKKGWDQINELVLYLKWHYGFQILEALERCSQEEQKKLDRQQRLEHIKSAYKLKPGIKKIPEEVWLIDDVSTTGSTLESCASVLKAAGAKKVYALTLFTVD
ncbi:MAG: hypothetical protein K5681_05780 [Treponema sp.]|nr:hypothetical protein [Treponema sp.]